MQKFVHELTEHIELRHPDLLADHAVSRYLSKLDQVPLLGAYHNVITPVEGFCNKIVEGHGLKGLTLFLQLVLATLIVRAEVQINGLTLDPETKEFYIQNFTRIKKQLSSNPPGFYQNSNDNYIKDLSLCLLRLMPMGAQKIILNGIPRMGLLNSGGINAVKTSAYIISQVGGFKPLYEMHTDDHDLSLLREFTPAGWDRCYLRIAYMLERNKDIKGVFGISWFFDPQLKRISPRLNFLRERPLENGAQIFFFSHDAQGTSGALVKSATRQKHFSMGDYIPANYLMIWPRKHLINWAVTMWENGQYQKMNVRSQ